MVFFRTLEVISRNIRTKDALRQLVILKQRSAGKADERCVWQCQPHVPGKSSCLSAMGLIGQDNDVIALAIGLRNWLVELVNQAEDEPVVFTQKLLKFFT